MLKRLGFVNTRVTCKAKQTQIEMKNGIIYIFAKWLLNNLKYLTLVEWFKYFAAKLNPNKTNLDKKLIYSRVSVDIFIILKWLFVIIIAKSNITNGFLTFFVWYLLLTNVYTYFYYHIWTEESLNTENFAIDRVRRRFINLMLAVGYSDLCFAYLYKLPYVKELTWSDNSITFLKSTWYSISNSLAANYEGVSAASDLGNSIAMTQLIITFIFVTIILGKSIPQTNSTQ